MVGGKKKGGKLFGAGLVRLMLDLTSPNDVTCRKKPPIPLPLFPALVSHMPVIFAEFQSLNRIN